MEQASNQIEDPIYLGPPNQTWFFDNTFVFQKGYLAHCRFLTKALVTCFSFVFATLLLAVAYILSSHSTENVLYALVLLNLGLLMIYFPFHLLLPVSSSYIRYSPEDLHQLQQLQQQSQSSTPPQQSRGRDPNDIFFDSLRKQLQTPLLSSLSLFSSDKQRRADRIRQPTSVPASVVESELNSHFQPLSPYKASSLLTPVPRRLEVVPPSHLRRRRQRFNQIYDSMVIEESDLGEPPVASAPHPNYGRRQSDPSEDDDFAPSQQPPLPSSSQDDVGASDHHSNNGVIRAVQFLLHTVLAIIAQSFLVFQGIIAFSIALVNCIPLPTMIVILFTSLFYYGGIAMSITQLHTQGVWFFCYHHILRHFLGFHSVSLFAIVSSVVFGVAYALSFPTRTESLPSSDQLSTSSELSKDISSSTSPPARTSSHLFPFARQFLVLFCLLIVLLLAMLPSPFQLLHPFDILIHIPTTVFYWVLSFYLLAIAMYLSALVTPTSVATVMTPDGYRAIVHYLRCIGSIFSMILTISLCVLCLTGPQLLSAPATPDIVVRSTHFLNQHPSELLGISGTADGALYQLFLPYISLELFAYLLWKEVLYSKLHYEGDHTSSVQPSCSMMSYLLTLFTPDTIQAMAPLTSHGVSPSPHNPGIHHRNRVQHATDIFSSSFQVMFDTIVRHDSHMMLLLIILQASRITSNTDPRDFPYVFTSVKGTIQPIFQSLSLYLPSTISTTASAAYAIYVAVGLLCVTTCGLLLRLFLTPPLITSLMMSPYALDVFIRIVISLCCSDVSLIILSLGVVFIRFIQICFKFRNYTLSGPEDSPEPAPVSDETKPHDIFQNLTLHQSLDD